MQEPNFPTFLGRYSLKKLIAKGGMGEVFLAYDPLCDRSVALKRIRPELVKYKNSPIRFIREAKIAAKLSHPSIIPIFDIVQDQSDVYYTMPYIEGESLRDILFKTIDNIKKHQAPHLVGSSIPALSRIFLSVCQAVSFAHSHHILHRDLKPGNIMVGKFGQVLILDWGLAKPLNEPSKDEEFEEIPHPVDPELTRPGKAVGTLSYMAPERAMGDEASTKSDIYSLGIVLYQLLTLKLPFKRQSIKDLKQTARFEKLIDPIEMAPYRDIPIQLSEITKKCLNFNPSLRYQTVDALIEDLESYIEGKPDWIFQSELFINKKQDWEFQENILLNRQVAITRSSYMMEWVALMISKFSFNGNLKMEIEIEVEKYCHGVGFLLSIPEKEERTGLEDGFCIWIGTKKNPGFKLFRSNVELLSFPDHALKTSKVMHLIIEKVDHRVKLFLDRELVINYVGYIPIVGTHIGLVSKDTEFKIHSWRIYTGSQDAMINCLSVPDAFLACKDFKKAYIEYSRIAESFKGRPEGREALFRAGITLLEEAKAEEIPAQKLYFYDLANLEFEKLKKTNGAPLEYLGKSLIYKIQGDIHEEVKCLELALRKFPKNPLLSMIQEEVIFRLHESAKNDRASTYLLALIVVRHLPKTTLQKETKSLIENLRHHLEPLFFQESVSDEDQDLDLALKLAFWSDKPAEILELFSKRILQGSDTRKWISNSGFSLLHLDNQEALKHLIHICEQEEIHLDEGCKKTLDLLRCLSDDDLSGSLLSLEILKNTSTLSIDELKALEFLIQFKLHSSTKYELEDIFNGLKNHSTSAHLETVQDRLVITLLLLLKDFSRIKPYFEKHSSELKLPLSPFYSLYGIYLLATQDEEKVTQEYKQLFQLPFPPLPSLFAHYLSGYIDLKKGWIIKSFYYEKIELFRQLALLYRTKSKRSKYTFFLKKLTKLTSQKEI
jgi:serine/threonine-protein kinase